MTDYLTDIDAIQARVGRLPGPRDLKVIDFVDAHAARWLEHASAAVLSIGNATALRCTAAGGAAGFAGLRDSGTVLLNVGDVDNADLLVVGASFGSVFLIPGKTETLRINGSVDAVDDATAELRVSECYLHCGKALLRSDFWRAEPAAGNFDDAQAFLAQCRLLVVGTIDAGGAADASPKGDPAG
ncbi:MAG: pyridoxamine 5'-phosphate oxidase, partial [Pseudomonadota bacterium]